MPRKTASDEQDSAIHFLCLILRERKRLLEADEYTHAHHRHVRELCSKLLWKHSESRGKYDGCRYWSTGALKSRERHKEVVQSRQKYGDDALRHEHVFPRKELILKLFDLPDPQPSQVQSLVERLNLGCVVTVSEDRKLPRKGTEPDPWDRYRVVGVSWVDRTQLADSA